MDPSDRKRITEMIESLESFARAEKGLSKDGWSALQRWLIREDSNLPAIESVNEIKDALKKYPL